MNDEERAALSRRYNEMPRARLEKAAAPVPEARRREMSVEVAGFTLGDDEAGFNAWWLTLTEAELAFLKLMRRGLWHIRRGSMRAIHREGAKSD